MEKFFLKKIELWTVLLAVVLLVPVLITWSIAAINLQIFPYNEVTEIAAWIRGTDEGEDITFKEKVFEDFLGKEVRTVADTETTNRFELEMQEVKDPKGLLKKSSVTIRFFAANNPDYDGYYVFHTYLDHTDARLGVVVLSAQGVVERVIPITQTNQRSKLGHGAITDYGNIVFPGKKEVFIYDYCGNYKFSSKNAYHHMASGDGKGFWSWIHQQDGVYEAVYVGYESQKVEKTLSILDILAANPDQAVLEPRLIKRNIKNVGRWKYSDIQAGRVTNLAPISYRDPFHANDIDVLTEHQAVHFPTFNAGDLLLSFRSINAIVVVDPVTLKIKWFSQGYFSRQHDPDWSDNGKITVYDNRSHTDASKIVQIDPVSNELTTLVSGEKWGFYQFSEGMSDYIHPSSALFTNQSEIIHISNDERIEFAITVMTDDGQYRYLRTPRYFHKERHQTLLENCS